MHIVITGAAGFLGKKLVQALLAKGSLIRQQGELQAIECITAVDIVALKGVSDPRLKVVCGDISQISELERLIGDRTDSVFHLAAVVSGQAEQDFDLGMKLTWMPPATLWIACASCRSASGW